MAIELTTKFAPYTDEVFKAESKRSILTNNDFDWTGAHTVKIYKVTTTGMNDYDREGAKAPTQPSRFGAIAGLDATTEEMTLKKDRSFTFAINKLDTDETQQQLQGASALARQEREVIIPEVDSYVYSIMCTNAGTAPAAIDLTSENIYSEILKASQTMDDAEVTDVGRFIVVTPIVYAIMKQSKEIVMNTDIGEDMRAKGVVSNLDGCNVIKVPSVRLPKNFGFLMVHPSATVSPVKLEDYRIHQDPPGISGALVEGRIVYDAFVMDNKKKALYYQAVTTA